MLIKWLSNLRMIWEKNSCGGSEYTFKKLFTLTFFRLNVKNFNNSYYLKPGELLGLYATTFFFNKISNVWARLIIDLTNFRVKILWPNNPLKISLNLLKAFFASACFSSKYRPEKGYLNYSAEHNSAAPDSIRFRVCVIINDLQPMTSQI